jgi:hypothetical protein
VNRTKTTFYFVVLCSSVLSQIVDTTVKVWSVILPQLLAITCCTPWGGSLGCVNHPGNQYPLKGQYGLGGSFRVRGRVLASSHIPISSISGSPVAGVLGNELVTRGDPLFPTFIYTAYILIWG